MSHSTLNSSYRRCSSQPMSWPVQRKIDRCTFLGYFYACSQNEYVGSFKHAARQEMSEAIVNAAMYVQFEASSNVIRASRLAVGGTLSVAAAAYDLTHILAGRFVCLLFDVS